MAKVSELVYWIESYPSLSCVNILVKVDDGLTDGAFLADKIENLNVPEFALNPVRVTFKS